MAIETTYIYSTDNSGLLQWLQANAVPDYFTSVVADSTTASTIHCYVGEQEVLTASINSSRPSVNFTAQNAAGATCGCTYSYAGYYAMCGYKCGGGLAISAGTSSAPYIPVFITKDSDGNTTIVLTSSITSTTSYTAVSCVDLTPSIVYTSCSVQALEATTIVPFSCGNITGETRYTPNAFYMPTAQYTEIGKLVIDGVAYLSSGAMLLKDEEIGGGASGDYVTPATFNAHAGNKQNPHEVSADQISVETAWQSAATVEDAINLLITSADTLAKSANSTGETIAEGTDLDTLTTPGTYCSPSAARSATLVHSPTSALAFRLEVKTVIGGRYVQICYPNWGGTYYTRNYLTAGWSNWYKYSGTEIVPETTTETE